MKIALSASFFNCPAIAEILHSCDIVFTTNPYALEHFAHKDIRAKKLWDGSHESESQGERFEFMRLDPVIIDFPDLYRAFHLWVAEVATDEELCDWAGYFGTGNFERIRERARGSIIPTSLLTASNVVYPTNV